MNRMPSLVQEADRNTEDVYLFIHGINYFIFINLVSLVLIVYF